MKKTFYSLLVLCSTHLFAQDPQFTQFANNQMYLNPAFTGAVDNQRFTAVYRNQWPGVKRSYSTYMVSYDKNLDDYNSGVGGYVLQDRNGSANLIGTSGVLNYAYKIKTGFSSQIRPSVSVGLAQKRIDFTKLVLNDQFITGAAVSEDVGLANTVTYLDLGTGAIFSSDHFWGGIAVKHLNRPNVNVLGGTENLPINISTHAGYRIVIKANDTNSVKPEQALSLMANFRHESGNDQLDFGLVYNYKSILAGIYYRGLPPKKNEFGSNGNEGLAIMAGVDLPGKNIKICYSYDLTISSLNNKYSAGAHELSINFELPKKVQKKEIVFKKKRKSNIKKKF